MYEQYGGNTYEDRLKNEYITTGTFKGITPALLDDLTDTEMDVWGGDTYVHFYDYTKMKKFHGDSGVAPDNEYSTTQPSERMNHNYAFPVESTLNLGLRTGYHFANKTSDMQGDADDTQPLDQRQIHPMYSADNDLIEFYPEQDYIEKEGQYDNRVLYSEEKATGNNRDSWRKFRPENYRDVDGGFVTINILINFKDQLFFFQDRGVGMLVVNPVAVTTTTDQLSLVLGTGAVLQDHNYVGINIGSKHQWSIGATNNGLYCVDILTNSIYRLSMNQGVSEISNIKGMKSYFEKRLENSKMSATKYDNLYGTIKEYGDTPTYGHGIVMGYDAKNKEVLFAFIERDFKTSKRRDGQALLITGTEERDCRVICYNENVEAFTSFYTFNTPMFINTQDKLMSIHPDYNHRFYIHNTAKIASWYDLVHDTTVKFISNKHPLETKVFDNYEWHTEAFSRNAGATAYLAGDIITNESDITWDFVQCTNDYQQNSKTLAVTDPNPAKINIKRRERTWKTSIVRNVSDNTRFRDKYLITKLTFKNRDHNNVRLRTHYVKTKFRVSRR